jgi:hypothetical protein
MTHIHIVIEALACGLLATVLTCIACAIADRIAYIRHLARFTRKDKAPPHD